MKSKKEKNLLNMKPIQGYPHYLITPEGHLYSTLTYKWLTPGLSSNGYMSFCLTKNKVAKTFECHQLVYDTFHNTTSADRKGFVIDHRDHCKVNNSLDNLQLITQKMNIQRSIAHKKKIMVDKNETIENFLKDMFF